MRFIVPFSLIAACLFLPAAGATGVDLLNGGIHADILAAPPSVLIIATTSNLVPVETVTFFYCPAGAPPTTCIFFVDGHVDGQEIAPVLLCAPGTSGSQACEAYAFVSDLAAAAVGVTQNPFGAPGVALCGGVGVTSTVEVECVGAQVRQGSQDCVDLLYALHQGYPALQQVPLACATP